MVGIIRKDKQSIDNLLSQFKRKMDKSKVLYLFLDTMFYKKKSIKKHEAELKAKIREKKRIQCNTI